MTPPDGRPPRTGPTAADAVSSPPGYEQLNRYTRVIVDEAVRRGIDVEIRDPGQGELLLRSGGRAVITFESLSELTSAPALLICADKALTRRVLRAANLPVPPGQRAGSPAEDLAFLAEHGEVVVKPVVGEGGAGISVGIVEAGGLADAVDRARAVHPDVLLEACVPGHDVRVVVIGGEVVAAAVRCPPEIAGDGTSTIAELVEALSARRAAETDGAAHLPFDAVTGEVVRAAGHEGDTVLAAGEHLAVRRTANVHTGGTITDITDRLHRDHRALAVAVAAAIAIPVVGVDLLVADVEGPGAVVIEANEQPGLANHEPQPTVERFVDLLFPGSG